jgi:prepilin-type N-terminal cleavage/methylation domain-containing protein
MKPIKGRRGFTIIEVMIAIIVLTVGLLGMVTTAALVTRMIGRGQRSAEASAFAAQRRERMRVAACVQANRVNGTDTLYRGSTWTAFNTWTYTDLGNQNYRLKVVSTYKTIKNKTRSDSSEITITCNPFL